MIRNVSGNYKSIAGGVDAGAADDLSLPAIRAINYSRNFTFSHEELKYLLRQMEYEQNFDPLTQVRADGLIIHRTRPRKEYLITY